MPDEETERVRGRIEDALSTAFAAETAVVSRWVVLAEVLTTGGERVVWTLNPPEQRAWDTLGLLRFADHLEAAAIVRDES